MNTCSVYCFWSLCCLKVQWCLVEFNRDLLLIHCWILILKAPNLNDHLLVHFLPPCFLGKCEWWRIKEKSHITKARFILSAPARVPFIPRDVNVIIRGTCEGPPCGHPHPKMCDCVDCTHSKHADCAWDLRTNQWHSTTVLSVTSPNFNIMMQDRHQLEWSVDREMHIRGTPDRRRPSIVVWMKRGNYAWALTLYQLFLVIRGKHCSAGGMQCLAVWFV